MPVEFVFSSDPYTVHMRMDTRLEFPVLEPGRTYHLPADDAPVIGEALGLVVSKELYPVGGRSNRPSLLLWVDGLGRTTVSTQPGSGSRQMLLLDEFIGSHLAAVRKLAVMDFMLLAVTATDKVRYEHHAELATGDVVHMQTWLEDYLNRRQGRMEYALVGRDDTIVELRV